VASISIYYYSHYFYCIPISPLTVLSASLPRCAGDRRGLQAHQARDRQPGARGRRPQMHPAVLDTAAQPAAAHLRVGATQQARRRHRTQGGRLDEHRRDFTDHRWRRLRHRPRLRQAEGLQPAHQASADNNLRYVNGKPNGLACWKRRCLLDHSS
jgi:hypothetical protein